MPPIPDNFSPWEHLQSILTQTQNRIVREEFSDVGDDTWEPDISTPRGSLRYGCTLQDNDTAAMTQLRLDLFYMVLRKAKDFQRPVYGIPVDEYQQDVSFRPQVFLYFAQDHNSIPKGKRAVEAQISFRLMNETSQTMTEAKAKTLANQIKSELCPANGYVFSKGKEKVTYLDRENGYDLRILATSELEGEGVVKKILGIRNHAYNPDNFNFHSPKRHGITNPVGTDLVYGKKRPKKRWRPSANVRFQWAYLVVYGLERAIYLVDRTGNHLDALVRG
jgi:hypothetical protein